MTASKESSITKILSNRKGDITVTNDRNNRNI